MADEDLLNKIQDLSDLELAVLICLTAQEHCIIDTDPNAIDNLVHELQLIASNTFGLSQSVIDCSEHTSLDDFASSVFAESSEPISPEQPVRTRQDSYFLHGHGYHSGSKSPIMDNYSDGSKIANVIIAKNLDEAPKQVQIQVLELMRTKRMYTHSSAQAAPKRLLLIALIAGGEGPRLTKHLNNHMFISHFHDPEDGFPNLEELENDGNSISSVVRKKAVDNQMYEASSPIFSASEVKVLENASSSVTISAEIESYIHNIIVFLRMHRAVEGGVNLIATRFFDKLVKCLASLHGLKFATPTLAALAARKIYPHRIEIVAPQRERSMQWGSDIEAVIAELEGVGPETVIDDVLGTVEVPL